MIPGVPYDAEIEYLESSGTQWIDTGVTPSSTMPFNVTFQNYGTFAPGFGNVFGSRAAGNNNEVQVTWYNGGSIGVGTRNSGLFTGIDNSDIVTVSFDGDHTATINGTQKSLKTSTITNITGSIIMFGIRSGGSVQQLQSGKIYNCKFGNVRDFIPVRVGQTGYLYDRVTKRLFGNKGTGSFVLGPDVAKPVMGLWGMRKFYSTTDYIQDGLVAMWDGENNTGHGHDSTAGIVDLSENGYDLVLTGVDARGPDYFALNTKGFYTVTNGAKIISAFDAGCLECEIVAAGNNGNCMLAFFGGEGTGFVIRPHFYTVSSSDNRYGVTAAVGNTSITAQVYQQPITHVGEIMQYALRYNSSSFTASCNSIKGSKNVATFTRANSYMVLGARANYTVAYRFDGRYYNVRLYNRALSAAEIAHNYQIDKARFNLP